MKVYPPLPLPIKSFEKLDVKPALASALAYVPSYITVLNSDNAQAFLLTDVSLPKVLFFTDKEAAPLSLKALSNTFNKKLKFGLVKKSENASILEEYKIRKFPHMIVLKTNNLNKPTEYKGEFNYTKMFEFLNIFSQ